MGAPQPWILRRHRVGLGYFAKEGFHFSCGHKRDQDPAAGLAAQVKIWPRLRL